jgi:hypothetical protein
MSEWGDMSIRGLFFQWSSTIKIQTQKKQKTLTTISYDKIPYFTTTRSQCYLKDVFGGHNEIS